MTVDQFNSLGPDKQQDLWTAYVNQCIEASMQPSLSDFFIYLEEQWKFTQT